MIALELLDDGVCRVVFVDGDREKEVRGVLHFVYEAFVCGAEIGS